MLYTTRITRRTFYHLGGFSNPNLYRKMRGRSWRYYRLPT